MVGHNVKVYFDAFIKHFCRRSGGFYMDNGTEPYIQRINELARKAKTVGLTDDELEERNELRKRYIEAFKGNLRSQLETIKFVDEEQEDSDTNQHK
jgi:uncharacterized protein YnzC (UPF0291/DUF896 family)